MLVELDVPVGDRVAVFLGDRRAVQEVADGDEVVVDEDGVVRAEAQRVGRLAGAAEAVSASAPNRGSSSFLSFMIDG